MTLLLSLHLLLLPVFVPSISGVRTAHEQVSAGIQWHALLLRGELQQPDGVIIIYRRKFS